MDKKKQKKILLYLGIKLGWLIILVLGKLIFIKEKNKKYVRQVQEKKAKFIYVLWHGKILVPIYVHRGEKIVPMISLHDDGELIAQTIYKLGYRPVRGSSTRGGQKAFYEMVRRINQGAVGTMIPDGPKGPRHQLKPGTLYIAQQTDAYLLPISYSSNRPLIFNSWDKFMLPLPFSKNIMIYGEPIKVPASTSARELVKIRASLEKQMVELDLQADEYFRK